MDVATLQARLARGEPTVVLDIRDAEDRDAWCIPGSRGIDVWDDLTQGRPGALATLDLPGDVPVVAVCYAGRTSMMAAQLLRGRGVHADSLDGGMQAWGHAWNAAETPLGDGTTVLQLRRTGRGCLSHLVASGGEAVVVDAVLDPDVYRAEAERRGWRIVAALDTHLHADHLSRSHRLAKRLGVPYQVSGKARLTFPYQELAEGDQVGFGDAALEVLATPGHTWDSSTYRVAGGAVLTGDTMFIDGVGRPDLGAGKDEVRDRAHALHDSLRRLAALPPTTQVLPAHASRPLAFDGKPWTATVADVQARVDLMGMDESTFVAEVLARTPEVPPAYHHIVSLNRAGEFPDRMVDALEAGANRCASG